jgi:hypothetical protein
MGASAGMTKTYNATCLRTEDIFDWARDSVDGRDPVYPRPPMGADDVLELHLSVEQVRELARLIDDSRNLKRLVKAMIGDALKDALA